jgi:hypothetical protein
MSLLDVSGAWRAASSRHRKVYVRRRWVEILMLSLRLVSVGLLSAVGWVHLHFVAGWLPPPPDHRIVVSGCCSECLSRRSRNVGAANAFDVSSRLRGGHGHSGQLDHKRQRWPVRLHRVVVSPFCRRVHCAGDGRGGHPGGLDGRRFDRGIPPD